MRLAVGTFGGKPQHMRAEHTVPGVVSVCASIAETVPVRRQVHERVVQASTRRCLFFKSVFRWEWVEVKRYNVLGWNAVQAQVQIECCVV